MSQCSGGGGALSTAAGGPWRVRLRFADAGRVGGADAGCACSRLAERLRRRCARPDLRSSRRTIVELRRRDLEDVAVLERRHPVNGRRHDVDAIAGTHLALDELIAFADLEQEQAGVQEDRLVLLDVIWRLRACPLFT